MGQGLLAFGTPTIYSCCNCFFVGTSLSDFMPEVLRTFKKGYIHTVYRYGRKSFEDATGFLLRSRILFFDVLRWG